MNTPNPLVPQGTLERQAKGKSTVRIAIFTIVSIHAVFFAGLLMQGCRRDEAPPAAQMALTPAEQNPLPPIPTNQYYASAQEVPPVADPTVSPGVGGLPSSDPPVNYLPPAETPPGSEAFPPIASSPLTPDKTKDYKVVRGDTLTTIAKRNGVTLSALKQANPDIDPRRLKIAQAIHIPPAPPASSSSDPGSYGAEKLRGPSILAGGGENIHVVKKGENLTRIARQYNTTVKALQAANNMGRSTRLLAGQRLKLPASGTTSASSEPSTTSRMSKLSGANL